MKNFKLLFLTFIGLTFIISCSKNEDEAPKPNGQNLVTQVITSQGGTINAPDGIQIIFPQGSVNNDTEVTVGYTGNENLTIENINAEIIGKPFTLKMQIDTLQQNIQIKIPKPSGYIQNKTAIIASINPKIPLEFVENGNYLIANFDNLPLNIAKSIFSNGSQTIRELVIGIVADKHLPIDAELGLKQVAIDNSGKMIFSNISGVTSSDKVLIMVHGWTGSPSTSWTEFLTKIQPQISQSGYTKFITFGYYSGSPINNNGAVFASQIQSQLNDATIDIVAHSMGGLVSRSAIENHKMASHIRNLITLGTPHKGSKKADLRQLVGRLFKTTSAYFNQSIDMGTQGMGDLQPSSVIIQDLINNPQPSTNYYPIAGKSSVSGVMIDDDGVVSLESALGIQNNSNGNMGQVFSFDVPLPLNAVSIYQAINIPHIKLTNEDIVIAHVATKLNSYNLFVPTNGLVAYYPFNGNANDESGNNNHGIVNGATLTTDKDGNVNNAYSFDGVDDYIEISNSTSLQNSNSITISAWVNATSYSYTNGEYIPILEKSNTSESGSYMLGYSLTSNSLYASLGGNSVFSTVPVIALNQWHHIVVTISSSNSFFYLDGVKYLITNNSSQPFNESMPIRIGQNTAGDNEVLNGKLDNISIYNRALSDLEVQTLFNN